MKTNKTTVGILFGGQSPEHDVSIISATALYKNMDKTKYDPRFIFISRDEGRWHIIDEAAFLDRNFTSKPGHSFLPWLNPSVELLDADIYFPMLHGPNGEDGRIQSLLELTGKPYVGASSISSALAMDKTVSKILFQKAGLKIADYLYFESRGNATHPEYDYEHIKSAVAARLPYPLFVKPSSMGSSVGISKVDNESQLKNALDLAFRYDRKVVIEQGLDIREIEVSVMGNEDIMVSRPGELIPHNSFYDYNDKYLDGKTSFYIPAHLDSKTEEEIRDVAGKAFKALFLNGMSRVDLFIEKQTGDIIVNEINTIPGFTEISMFPKLWTLQGISFTELIDRLIQYGFEFQSRLHIATGLHEGIGSNETTCH